MTTSPTTDSRWWPTLQPADDGPDLRLLLCAHSGAGANAMRPLAALAGYGVEVRGLSLPGRERRIKESADTTLDEVTATWHAEGLDDGIPTILVGHSLGALLAAHLAATGGSDCHGLLVSGHRPSSLDGGRQSDPITDEDVAKLHRAGGTPDIVFDDPAWREHLERALRSDIRLGREAGSRIGEVQLSVPIATVTGDDDPFAPPSTMHEWGRHTTAQLSSTNLPGGHFALFDEASRATIDLVLRELRRQGGAP